MGPKSNNLYHNRLLNLARLSFWNVWQDLLYYQPARFDPCCAFFRAKPRSLLWWKHHLIFLSVPQDGFRLPTNESFNGLVASETGVKRICRLTFAWNEGLAKIQGKLNTENHGCALLGTAKRIQWIRLSHIHQAQLPSFSGAKFLTLVMLSKSMSNLDIPGNTVTKMRTKRTKHWPFPDFPGVLKEESPPGRQHQKGSRAC